MFLVTIFVEKSRVWQRCFTLTHYWDFKMKIVQPTFKSIQVQLRNADKVTSLLDLRKIHIEDRYVFDTFLV